MASIYAYDIESTSFSVMLIDLQTSGVTYTRKCSWTAYENSSGNYMASGNTYITAGETEGGDYTFTGMSPDTEYFISCQVTRTDTNAQLATFSIVVTTSSSGGGDSGGDDTEPIWEYERKLGYVISDYFEESVYVPPYTTLIYEITFEIESAVRFYTSGDYATKGYLGNSLRFDETTGIPPYLYGVINFDDEGYDNFYFAHKMHTDRTYYLYVQNWDGENASWFTLHIEPYEEAEDTEWSWSDTAYNAFLNNGDTRDVTYTEWNEFVEFVASKTGYYLDSALMPYYDTYLYANQFNEVRAAIGSINTFKNGTNSIKDHYNDTGCWDMSSGEVVKGQYFIDLTKYLNAI